MENWYFSMQAFKLNDTYRKEQMNAKVKWQKLFKKKSKTRKRQTIDLTSCGNKG